MSASRGADEHEATAPEAIVRRFVEAVNEHDANALVALLAPDVELRGLKGTYHGHDGARRWLGEPGVNLRSTIELDSVRNDGGTVFGVGRRRWHWVEDGELAEEHEWGAAWEIRGGAVRTWRAIEMGGAGGGGAVAPLEPGQ